MSCPECKPYGLSSCPMCEEPPKECPSCRGFGVVDCTALNIATDEEVDVTQETFYCLPSTRMEAEQKRQNYIRLNKEPCHRCGGSGKVWEKE